jgi:NAD+ diphosphatase
MKQPNFYSAGGVDRVSALRKDPGWLAARLAERETRFVPVWRALNLVQDTVNGPVPLLLDRDRVAPLLGEEAGPVLLGLDGDRAVFALDLSATESPLEVAALDSATHQFRDLRAFGPLLGQREGALLAYAKGMMHWHSRHRFCGVCGHPTCADEAGHVRRCVNPDCKTSHFPRTDPAVIMLVEDGENCLLGRQAAWPAGMYSTLAGFVEPGESLEEAVAREVFEEAGIEIGQVTYHSSQPWPFPASVMLGFTATARTREVRVDKAELQDARWFSRRWLEATEDGPEFRRPRKDSIARRLLEDWLRQG